MKKLINFFTILGAIFAMGSIILCIYGSLIPVDVLAQRVGRMGVLVIDPNGRDQFVQSIDFQNTDVSIGSSADVTIDLSVSSGFTQDTTNKYIYTTDGDYLVGLNDSTPDGQLDIDISGAAVVGLDIDGAAAQSANIVDIDDATGDALFTIDALGNVGIGTTGPGVKLEVDNGNIEISRDDGSPSILFLDKDDDDKFAWSFARSNNRLDLEIDGTDIHTFLQNGNVGIGTTLPGVKLEVNGLIRSTSSEWYAYEFVTVYSADPGASGATRVAPSADTLGGWNLDADGETLEFTLHVCSDWDETSDVYIRIEYEVDDGTATGNAVFDAEVYMKGVGDYVTKNQSLTFIQDVSGDDQYTLRHNDLTIDYDDATQDLSVDDHISVVLNFDATASDITDVILVGGTMRYQTNKPRVEIP